jgi:Ca-activated chloride channel family protein
MFPRALKLLSTLLVLIFTFAIPAVAADKSIIVFDASGSMWAQIEGKTRIEIARETISSVLKDFPADRELGLMAYGHREKGSCSDIELVVPPAAGTAGAISDAVAKINPKGKTPLSDAVKKAAEELKFTEEKATVILVTDGLETCNADPCALGNELEKAGVDFTAHVVGFGLSAEEGKQVACLAENTGGKYLQASDAGQLTEALKTTVIVVPEPAPEPAPEPTKPDFNFMPTVSLAEGGEEIKDRIAWDIFKAAPDGSRGESVRTEYNEFKGTLEPGDYIVIARMDLATSEQKVTIKAGDVANPHFVLNAGTLKITPKATQTSEPDANAAVLFLYPGGDWTGYGPTTTIIPAGEQTVKVKIGEAEVSQTFALKAGEVIEKDIVAGVGVATVNAYYVEGMKVDASGLAVNILEAKPDINGNRKDVAYNYGPDKQFSLPPGDYLVRFKQEGAGGEAPFTIKTGDSIKVDVVLNAGVVAGKQPGYDGWEIVGAAKKIDGSRESFTYGYGAEWQTTLPAGDYVVISKSPDGAKTTETPFTVKAGERAELTVQ